MYMDVELMLLHCPKNKFTFCPMFKRCKCKILIISKLKVNMRPTRTIDTTCYAWPLPCLPAPMPEGKSPGRIGNRPASEKQCNEVTVIERSLTKPARGDADA